jgi:hypothetical protein
MLGLVILEKFYVVYYTKKRQDVANYSSRGEENKGLFKKREIRISSSYAEGDRRWKSKNLRGNSQLVPKSLKNPKVA